MELETKQKLLEVYNNFIESEYGNEPLQELPETIGLMFTTIDDDMWEVQVSYDTKNELIIVDLWNGATEQEFTYKEQQGIKYTIHELEYVDFNDYYSWAHQMCEEHFCLDLEW